MVKDPKHLVRPQMNRWVVQLAPAAKAAPPAAKPGDSGPEQPAAEAGEG